MSITKGKSFRKITDYLGVHPTGKPDEFSFAIYEPNALAVTLLGDFTSPGIPCQRADNGIFSATFLANVGDKYFLKIETSMNEYYYKVDPLAFQSVKSNSSPIPYNSVISDNIHYFFDEDWLEKSSVCIDKPLNIYELHVGTFNEKGSYLSLTKTLIPYISKMGYTHIELMPITEHPNPKSWGYQSTGYFSPCSQWGTPDELKNLINYCHLKDIGVILDLPLIHFAVDEWGLDHPSNLLYSCGEYSQWDSPLFNLESAYVRCFLMSSADFWLEHYHFDGIRFDAVGELINNPIGEQFIKKLTAFLKKNHPKAILIAEDSTIDDRTTKPLAEGGFGFDFKWNLGWMNDTLTYLAQPIWYRSAHHQLFAYPESYQGTARYILPLSHDEIVHEKSTLVNKIDGNPFERYETIKLLYLYKMIFSGKKLSFMGNELGISDEWNEITPLDFSLLNYTLNREFHDFIKALNHVYRRFPAFYNNDESPDNFIWLDKNNAIKSTFIGKKTGADGEELFLVLNLSCSFQTVSFGCFEDVKSLIATASDIEFSCKNGTITLNMPPLTGIILQKIANKDR